MISLKDKVAEFIDSEKRAYIDMMLDADWADSIAYYGHDIYLKYLDLFGNKTGVYESDLVDYAIYYQSEILDYAEQGFPYAEKGYFSIANIGDIEVEVPDWLKRRKPETVNRYTDLYISGNGYGYINADYDSIRIDIIKLRDCILNEKENLTRVVSEKDIIIYADSSRGVYIPQFFAESYAPKFWNIQKEDADILQAGPNVSPFESWYWGTWDKVLNYAFSVDPGNGVKYRLEHDGDLFLVPFELETME